MNTKSHLSIAALVVAALTAGCENKATAPAVKSPQVASTPAVRPQPLMDPAKSPLPPGVDASVESTGLHVSDAIARACGLPKQDAKTSFDFDSATISEDDKTLLQLVAKCMTEGPLRGKNVSLIGRADPRGEDEYNMSLGGTRSDAVLKYLHDLGVQRERLTATSRGELDATGRDETGWAKDRRVDIELATNLTQ